MNAKLQALISQATENWKAHSNSGLPTSAITVDTSSLARGAEETLARMREVIAEKNLKVEVVETGSWGFCWTEPTVSVRSAAGTRTVLYAETSRGSHRGLHPEDGRRRRGHPRVGPGRRRRQRHAGYPQARRTPLHGRPGAPPYGPLRPGRPREHRRLSRQRWLRRLRQVP
ncbi:MAG: hypothetical protein U5Q44_08485 [Dehalococcoidia bacterium]|nr:hypothetical protein [Dehalococcoidia bacterium]